MATPYRMVWGTLTGVYYGLLWHLLWFIIVFPVKNDKKRENTDHMDVGL